MEPGDFAIPFVDTENKKVELYLTDRIPLDDVPTLIFFDELPNADPRVQVAIYQMVLDRNLAGHPLHDNTYIMAAGNSIEDNCNVNEMSAALADRFTHLKLIADVQEWILWAQNKGLASEVITFLRVKPEFFSGNQNQVNTDQMIFPTPRSWEAVSQFFTNPVAKGNRHLLKTLVAGRIGKAATASFFGVLEELDCLPEIEKLFNAKNEAELLKLLKPVVRLAPLYGLAYSVYEYVTDVNSMIRATEIFNVVADIQDDLPRSEIQTLAQELIYQKVTIADPMDTMKYLESSAYAKYSAKGESLKLS